MAYHQWGQTPASPLRTRLRILRPVEFPLRVGIERKLPIGELRKDPECLLLGRERRERRARLLLPFRKPAVILPGLARLHAESHGFHRRVAHRREVLRRTEFRRRIGNVTNVRPEELRRPDAGLQVFAARIEVDRIDALRTDGPDDVLSPRRHRAEELHGKPRRDDVESVLLRERTVVVRQALVHAELVDAPAAGSLRLLVADAAVKLRIAPGLLHDDLCLRRVLADLLDESVAPRMERLRPPALVRRLLDGDNVPLVRPEDRHEIAPRVPVLVLRHDADKRILAADVVP